MPLDGFIQVGGIDNHTLGLGGCAFGEFLGRGDEGLGGGIPVYPCIFRDRDLIHFLNFQPTEIVIGDR